MLPTEYADSRIGDLPVDVRERYEGAVSQLAAAPLGHGGEEAARYLQTVLSEIRHSPDFADFGTRVSLEDLLRATEPGWPLVYINPTPHGLLLSRIDGQPSTPVVDTQLLPSPGSSEVFMRIMTGTSAPTLWTDDMVSFMAEASGFGELSGARIREALDVTLPWVGETVVRPVWDLINRDGLEGVTLIPCGPLTLVPLHACPWTENGQTRCLLDNVAVRYAPSGLAAAVSIDRARRRLDQAPSFLGLADPKANLPAAVPEVRAIGSLFQADEVLIAEREDATATFLTRSIEGRSHLHLACHGRGGLVNIDEAEIYLADRPMSALELAALPGLTARTCVLSACQTAVAEFNDQPDEAMSVSTALLVAGSASVVASLWSVDDASTAMLMTRFYEEMLVFGRSPAAALRHAQLWLRDLEPDDEQRFLTDHPTLAQEWRRRLDEADPVGQRGKAGGAQEHRYGHVDNWAPFIVTGA